MLRMTPPARHRVRTSIALVTLVAGAVACGGDDAQPADDTTDASTSNDAGSGSSSASDGNPSTTLDSSGSEAGSGDEGSTTAGTGGESCTVELLATFEPACASFELQGDATGGALAWAAPATTPILLRLDGTGALAGEPEGVPGDAVLAARRSDDVIGLLIGEDATLSFGLSPAGGGAIATTPLQDDAVLPSRDLLPLGAGWAALTRRTITDVSEHDVVELTLLDADGSPQGAATMLADLGDDVGYQDVVLAPRDGGAIALWNDFDDPSGAWRVSSLSLDDGGTQGTAWSVELGAVLCGAWSDARGLVMCTHTLSDGAVQRRDPTDGALLAEWRTDEGTTLVDAAPSAGGTAVLLMDGGFVDSGPTTLRFLRLDDTLAPIGEPLIIADQISRLAFSVAAVGDAVLAASCVQDTSTLELRRITCDG